MKENQKICVEKDFQKYYRKILVDNPLSQYSCRCNFWRWVGSKDTIQGMSVSLTTHIQLTYNWLDYEKEFQGIPLKSQRKSSNLKQPSISLSDPTPQDFLRGRLPKLKRNAPMFLLVSHRVPGVPQWVPLTAEWMPIDSRVSAGPMLVSKPRSPICVHRCPPVAAIGVHGVPPASAVARHCGVVTSIRRNIHIFGVHCFTLAHSVEPIWCPLAAWCCTISPLHHC